MNATAPHPRAALHLMSGTPSLAFAVEGSRLFEVGPEMFEALQAGGAAAELELLDGLAPVAAMPAELGELEGPSAVSLNLVQSCNLSCGYCYADEGRFGGPARTMPEQVALEAVDRLIASAPGPRVTVGFIGGEPFLARDMLHRCVDYAETRGLSAGIKVGFSVTTNGTLLRGGDLDLLRRHRFAVTVSIDGGRAANDRHRRSGHAGSFDQVMRAVAPLLADPGGARITARATVARDDLEVADRVAALSAAGFAEVGVSPVRTSPDPALPLQDGDWPAFLQAMVRAAVEEANRVEAGLPPRFANLWTAMREIHRGASKPLPCGAVASYLSVGADGGVYTCHRTVGDARERLGSLSEFGASEPRRRFLQNRLVNRSEPCSSCWARYLCGGGCHAEVAKAGRTGCDFIRGWLEHCMHAYVQLLPARPDLFA